MNPRVVFFRRRQWLALTAARGRAVLRGGPDAGALHRCGSWQHPVRHAGMAGFSGPQVALQNWCWPRTLAAPITGAVQGRLLCRLGCGRWRTGRALAPELAAMDIVAKTRPITLLWTPCQFFLEYP